MLCIVVTACCSVVHCGNGVLHFAALGKEMQLKDGELKSKHKLVKTFLISFFVTV